MGLARAAELNGCPGPGHILKLAALLDLTPEQRTETEALRASMEAKAIPLGRALVEQEHKLDRLFEYAKCSDGRTQSFKHSGIRNFG